MFVWWWWLWCVCVCMFVSLTVNIETIYHIFSELNLIMYSQNLAHVSDFKINTFQIGVTDENPSLMMPNLCNYEVCGINERRMGPGERFSLDCVGRGRYFIIQSTKTSQYLGFCEVEVFGRSELLVYSLTVLL